MYRDKEHEMLCHAIFSAAIYNLEPKTLKDLFILDEFLWELDIDCDCINLSSVESHLLKEHLERIISSESMSDRIKKELMDRCESDIARRDIENTY